MSGHTLLVHPDVDDWMRAQPDLRRRVDWLLFELTTRGDAGRPKGIVGPSALVTDAPALRWRRSGVGGFHYYAWWFPATGWDGIDDGRTIVVRAVRHHDEMRPLAAGSPDTYSERNLIDLDPLTEEQRQVMAAEARVRVVVGQPGHRQDRRPDLHRRRRGRSACRRMPACSTSRSPSGWSAPPRSCWTACPASRGASRSWRSPTCSGAGAGWSAPRSPPPRKTRSRSSAAPCADSPRETSPPGRTRIARSGPRSALTSWGRPSRSPSRRAACRPPTRRSCASPPTLRRRAGQLSSSVARAAHHAAQVFVGRQDLPSVQREAWAAIGRIERGALDRELRAIGGLIVDEIQDLTLLQIAVLAKAAQRAGELHQADGVGYGPLFVAAGDESQVVHPSGFDWGSAKDLLAEILDASPREITLRLNQRSPVPLIEVANRTSKLYDDLPREYRPRGSAQADTGDAPGGDVGEVALTTVAPDDPDLGAWLDLLADTPHGAVVTAETRSSAPTDEALDALLADQRFDDLRFTAGTVKGLDRQYVVLWGASRILKSIRDEIEAAKERGGSVRYLVARTGIDELRVALSRSTETLVLLDTPDAETDPLLQEMADDGLLKRRSIAFLRARLEERNADARERALGFLEDTLGLLESDLDRALRTLIRFEAALAGLVDADQRREVLERSIEVRRLAASALVRQCPLRRRRPPLRAPGRHLPRARPGGPRRPVRRPGPALRGGPARLRRGSEAAALAAGRLRPGPRRPRRRRSPGAAVRPAARLDRGGPRAGDRRQRRRRLPPGERPPAGRPERRRPRRRDRRAPRRHPRRRPTGQRRLGRRAASAGEPRGRPAGAACALLRGAPSLGGRRPCLRHGRPAGGRAGRLPPGRRLRRGRGPRRDGRRDGRRSAAQDPRHRAGRPRSPRAHRPQRPRRRRSLDPGPPPARGRRPPGPPPSPLTSTPVAGQQSETSSAPPLSHRHAFCPSVS